MTGKLLLLGLIVLNLVFVATSLIYYTNYNDEVSKKEQRAQFLAENIAAEKEVQIKAQYAEEEKKPYRTMITQSVNSSVNLQYPKTWSLYKIEKTDGTPSVNAYFDPDFVHSVDSSSQPHALRYRFDSERFNSIVGRYEKGIESGNFQSETFVKKGVSGVLIKGDLFNTGQSSAMAVIPVRDKTIRLWTASSEYINDFEHALSSLDFNP